MTTTWPQAPAGLTWRELDRLVDLVDPLVAAQSRPDGVHQVRWDPSRATRVAFEAVHGQTMVLEATQGGVSHRSLAEDRALPGLRAFLDPTAAAQHLEEALGTTAEHWRMRVVSYRPGSRCVLRLTAAPTGASGPEQDVFVKVLATGVHRCVEHHERLAGTLGPHLPRLVGAWPQLGAFALQAVPGPSASTLLADRSADAELRARLAGDLGALLGLIHASPWVPRRSSTPADPVEEIERCLPAAWQADAATALSLGWLAQRLRERRPSPAREVFSHGSFRAGQVVVQEGALVVLDLDASGAAPPECDLGTALAYLDWQALRDPHSERVPLSETVRDGYLATGADVDESSLSWWRALALARVAARRYRSLDTRHWDAVPALVEEAADRLEPTRRSSSGTAAERLTHVLRASLSQVPRAEPETAVTVTDVETLRVATGRRVVQRARLAGAADPGLAVIVKGYAEADRAGRTFENLTVFATLGDPAARFGSQTPLDVLADRGLVVAVAAPGEPATALGRSAEGPEVVVDVAARCGAWLRGVHTSPQRLSRTFELRREVANLREWATLIARSDPRWACPVADLAEALAQTSYRLPLLTTSVIHKDMHLGHVIIDDAGWARVIDLDEARMGDPAFDVAHLSAYAEELGLLAARDAFLSAYGEVPGEEASLRLAWFRAYTLVKITKQQAHTHTRDEPGLHRGLRRLQRGLSCLVG